MQTIPVVTETIGNILECFSVDRFIPASSENELQDVASALNEKKLFFGGIYFNNANLSSEKDISYAIRMDIDNTPITIENRNLFWFPGPGGSFVQDMRYHRGFIEMQHVVDTGIIKWFKKRQNQEKRLLEKEQEKPNDHGFGDFSDDIGSTEKAESPLFDIVLDGSQDDAVTILPLDDETEDYLNFNDDTGKESTVLNRTKRAPQFGGLFGMLGGSSAKADVPDVYEIDKMQFFTKQFPYPKYRFDDFKKGLYLSQAVQMAFFFSLLVQIAATVRYRIWAKESGNRRVCIMKLLILNSRKFENEYVQGFFIALKCIGKLYDG